MFRKMILLVLLMNLYSYNSFAVVCPKPPKPKLVFSMKKTETKFNFSKTAAELTSQNLAKKTQLAGWINEGVMSAKFPNYEISAKIGGITYPTLNQSCYWVEEINFFWLLEPTIYVAKDYPRGSCKYRTVISHERQHVSIDISVLQKYKDYIKNNLERQCLSPIATGLITTQKNINLLASIEAKLKPIIDQMISERNSRQQAIDTVEEYKRIANLCK